MKTLKDYIIENSINEAIQPEETIQIKDGKNFIDAKAKNVKLIGHVKYAEVYFENDSYVESIDFSGLKSQDLYFYVVQCNKLKSIIGGAGDRIHARIRKNVKLESLDISGYDSFGNDVDQGQVTYINTNKSLKLSDKDLPKLVTDKHGLNIVNGVKYMRSNGLTGKNKLQENK